MAAIYPFRGYRYSPEQVGDLNKVVTPPYDKISKEEHQQYLQASPYNISRLILGSGEEEGDYYAEAARTLEEWVDEEILQQDSDLAFYPYFQEYKVDGETKLRRGFVGLGELSDELEAKAHEDIMEAPKSDRMELLRATESNFGHIFMLYSDPERKVNQLLEDYVSESEPLVNVKDQDKNVHKLWRMDDQDLVSTVQDHFDKASMYIADGHHRYQAALQFRDECLEEGWSSIDHAGFDVRMMTFVNTEDPGLTILPTHRLLHGLSGFSPRGLLEKAREDFVISRFNTAEDLFDKMDGAPEDKHVFGYRSKGGRAYWSLTYQKDVLDASMAPEKSSRWRGLDVSILHKALLERHLGITEEDLEQKNKVDYVRGRENAMDQLSQSGFQAVFFLNPTTVSEVLQVADGGETMPQKSTDFYPKLLTGPVIHRMNIDKE